MNSNQLLNGLGISFDYLNAHAPLTSESSLITDRPVRVAYAKTEAEPSPEDLLERLSDGLITLNQKWIITSSNIQAQRIFGRPRGLLVGRHISDVFQTPNSSKYYVFYQKVLVTKKSFKFEETLDDHHYLIEVHPAKEGVAIFFKDITTLKRTQAELREARAARNDFLSIVSHELKTPLTALKLQVEMASRKINKGDQEYINLERLRSVFANAHQDVKRLSRLVDDMLDVSRIDNGKLSMHFAYFSLDEFMREGLQRLSLNYSEFQQLVNFKLETPLLVYWDRFRMEQVLVNLMTNAFRYGAGSPIEVTTYQEEEFVFISVRDHGIGIPKENQAKIFEKFERGKNSHNFGGLGLGLFICHEIVKRHGGMMSLKSAPGFGSTFTVKMPLTARLDG